MTRASITSSTEQDKQQALLLLLPELYINMSYTVPCIKLQLHVLMFLYLIFRAYAFDTLISITYYLLTCSFIYSFEHIHLERMYTTSG